MVLELRHCCCRLVADAGWRSRDDGRLAAGQGWGRVRFHQNRSPPFKPLKVLVERMCGVKSWKYLQAGPVRPDCRLDCRPLNLPAAATPAHFQHQLPPDLDRDGQDDDRDLARVVPRYQNLF